MISLLRLCLCSNLLLCIQNDIINIKHQLLLQQTHGLLKMSNLIF